MYPPFKGEPTFSRLNGYDWVSDAVRGKRNRNKSEIPSHANANQLSGPVKWPRMYEPVLSSLQQDSFKPLDTTLCLPPWESVFNCEKHQELFIVNSSPHKRNIQENPPTPNLSLVLSSNSPIEPL